MATIYAPQYRDPNAQFKQTMMQVAMMLGRAKGANKLSDQRAGDIQNLAQYGENIGDFNQYQTQTQNELSGVLSAEPGSRLPELANVMQGKMDPNQFNTPIPRRPQFPQLKSPGMQDLAGQLMLNRALPQRMTPYQKAMLKLRAPLTETQKLIKEGYSPTEAKLALDISKGLKPRASVRKKYDTMDDTEKLDFLNKMEDRAKGQYYGVTEGYEAAVDQPTLDWVTAEKAKLPMFKGKQKTGSSAEGTPTPTTQAEYDAIPTGTDYMDTDGVVRKKK